MADSTRKSVLARFLINTTVFLVEYVIEYVPEVS